MSVTVMAVSSFSHFACFVLMCSLIKATVIPNVTVGGADS